MENITAAELIKNHPASTTYTKPANPQTEPAAPRGFIAESYSKLGESYSVRPLANVYACASEREWDAYNSAVAAVLTWYANETEYTLEYPAEVIKSAYLVIGAMMRRANPFATTPAEKSAPRIDNAIEYAAADCDGRAPRGKMQAAAYASTTSRAHVDIYENALTDAITEYDRARAAAAEMAKDAKERRRRERIESENKAAIESLMKLLHCDYETAAAHVAQIRK